MKKKVMSLALAAGVLFSSGELVHASLGDDIINTGDNYLGTPYKYGSAFGNTRTFDCSSFTSYVFSRHGITLPRTSSGQASTGTYVSKANLQKGDLVFYDTDFNGSINHVGIYAGNGKMLNAQSKGVAFADAFSPYYWGSRYVTARRVINDKAAAAKVVAAAPKPTTVYNSNGSVVSSGSVHKVQRGDTLWGISKKYKTTVANIQKLNLLKSTTIRVGQSLKVNGQAVTVKTQTAKPAPTKVASSTAATYTVKSGNTLYGISKSYGITVKQLMDSNNLKSTTILPGQKLIIEK
ncbi:C40 family peptidase [Fictibacillus norfolkensis]|uniref:LysM peptidoglycan-binding domain-containing protein n=1 Tax=Fictibacillus norfolkensis TaxID=2762233 RepID=A0ABR8SI68_9BACL|nr:C40 family peptidase [Fictibacillus norfolkensis]MBD7963196.1 LysM peptidoglycan-binding domain-containing protein [Fictibacillus norfolkensis]